MAKKKSNRYEGQFTLDLFADVIDTVLDESRTQTATELENEQFKVTPVAAAVAATVEPEVFFEITDQLNCFGTDREKIATNLKAISIVAQLRSGDLRRKDLTAEQKNDLVRYTGWGGLSAVFKQNGPYQAECETLRSLVSEREFEAARASMLTAYYTPVTVIKAMWDILGKMGFTGGRVLEPAAGIGHFIGLMPTVMREQSQATSGAAMISDVINPGGGWAQLSCMPSGRFSVSSSYCEPPTPPATCWEQGTCPPPFEPTCEQLGTCAPPPTCEQLGTCPAPPELTCEQLGTCAPPPTCEQLGTCAPPPPPALTCEQLGTCPPPPTCEELGNCLHTPAPPPPPPPVDPCLIWWSFSCGDTTSDSGVGSGTGAGTGTGDGTGVGDGVGDGGAL